MKLTRQRVDRFTSIGNRVTVTGRRDHTFSTEQYIERPHLIKFDQPAEDPDSAFYYPGPRGIVRPYTSGRTPSHLKALVDGAG